MNSEKLENFCVLHGVALGHALAMSKSKQIKANQSNQSKSEQCKIKAKQSSLQPQISAKPSVAIKAPVHDVGLRRPPVKAPVRTSSF